MSLSIATTISNPYTVKSLTGMIDNQGFSTMALKMIPINTVKMINETNAPIKASEAR